MSFADQSCMVLFNTEPVSDGLITEPKWVRGRGWGGYWSETSLVLVGKLKIIKDLTNNSFLVAMSGTNYMQMSIFYFLVSVSEQLIMLFNVIC